MHADLTENADSDLHKLLTEIQHTDDEQQALQAEAFYHNINKLSVHLLY